VENQVNEVQAQRERSIGERFIIWYNDRRHASYRYVRRGDPAPDLIFQDGATSLGVEVTEAFYDTADAKFKWKALRNEPDAPRTWAGVEPDEALASQVATQIAKKAPVAYGSSCVLVVDVDPTVTNPIDLERLLPTVSLPVKHSFQGIYVGGVFWASSANTLPGYKCWAIFEA
jgi:hypothetical protein